MSPLHSINEQLSGGLKRKNSNTFPIKSKVKRTDSMSSMSMETCSNRSSSDGDLQTRTETEKKRKMKSERPDSPCHRSFADLETEPYLNSYPIQMSTGNSYPQDNLMSEGNSTADWYNLGNTQGQGQPLLHGQTQRYQQNMLSSGYSAGPNFCGPDLSQMGYTHGMDCNAHTNQYYQSQSYPPMLPQVNISHCIQQMDFPDPFGIGNADLNGLDLCWLVDDMDMPDSAADVYGSRTTETQQETPHTQTNFERTSPTTESSSIASKVHGNVAAHAIQESKSSNSECSTETSSAFGSSEAYTSYEESSLTSCTSSDDGCYDDFDASPTQDQTMGDAMAVITNTNSQRRRLSKSSLARNNSNSTTNGTNSNSNNGNYYSIETCTTSEMQNKEFTTRSTIQPTQPQSHNQNLTNCLSTNSNSDGTGWFRGNDEDLVLGIVEAFSS